MFLGHQPYPVGGVWYWGPTLARRLFKHHVMLQPTGDLRAWLHGVARMEMLCYPHVPVLYDQAQAVCRQLEGHKVTKYEDRDAQHKAQFSGRGFRFPHYDATTVAHVESMYCLPPGAIEDFVQKLPAIPAMLDHIVLDAFMARDDM